MKYSCSILDVHVLSPEEPSPDVLLDSIDFLDICAVVDLTLYLLTILVLIGVFSVLVFQVSVLLLLFTAVVLLLILLDFLLLFLLLGLVLLYLIVRRVDVEIS